MVGEMSGVRVGNGIPGVGVMLGVGIVRVCVAAFVGKSVFVGNDVGGISGFSGIVVLTKNSAIVFVDFGVMGEGDE
jgi:hypothetical protein